MKVSSYLEELLGKSSYVGISSQVIIAEEKNFVTPTPVVKPNTTIKITGITNNKINVRLSDLILPNSFLTNPPKYII
jgi:hypothetical protein